MSDATLPIDIHTNKLLDWLISRRHCKKDFQKSIDTIRGKIKLAIHDMPQIEEVRLLLQQNVLDYHACQRIIEILKNTDKSSRNIFGQYTSKRMLDWQEIAKLYEKDNVYLAEDAQTLIRNVNYEIPSLKKLSAKYQQQTSDLERAIETCKKQSKSYMNDYNLNAKKLGIEGVDIKKELYSQLEDLPKKMEELSAQLPSLISVCDYYKTFVFFISQSEIDCLPMLHYLLAKGNTTYFEYRTGNPPDIVEDFKLGNLTDTSDGSANSVDDNGIDFGDSIDFGDDNASTDTPSTGNSDFVTLEKDELDNEINWDTGDVTELKLDQASVDNGEQAQRVARGEDAYSVLLNSECRNKFINELIEVENFLGERLNEMESEHILSSYLFQSAPSVLQLTTIDGVREMLVQVVQVRESFESDALKALYYMKDSPKYIDNIFKKLVHLKTLSERSIQKVADLESKRSDLLNELALIGPQIDVFIERTKSLQRHVESSISNKYNHRPVNIMGGVQVL